MTTRTKASAKKASARTRTMPKRQKKESSSRSAVSSDASTATTRIRSGSKQALLVTRLGGPTGARIADLTQELNWLPHTVRAALTRLRQKGYAVIRSKTEGDETVYRATPPAAKRSRSATKTTA